jgi:DNA-binding HxlR family transcriptional regulator
MGVNKDKIILDLIKVSDGVKTKFLILESIKKGLNSFDKLESLGFSKPLLSFHINGTVAKRSNGLITLGFITKDNLGKRLDKFEYSLTDEGVYILDLLDKYGDF